MRRGAIQFAWLFAIIVGAAILFLAFYFIGTHLLSQQMQKETLQAQYFEAVLNPLSYLGSIGAVSIMPFELNEPSWLNVSCEEPSEVTVLGWNEISIKTKEERAGLTRKSYDKYLFIDYNHFKEKVRKVNSLTISFEMPWRVADLTMLWPAEKTYCFVNDSTEIQELQELLQSDLEESEESTKSSELPPILFKGSYGECPTKSITVCYSAADCDIIINEKMKIVEKEEERAVKYAGKALLLAAIFSSPDLYECNVKRLAKRLLLQIEVYRNKAERAGMNLDSLKQPIEEISRGNFNGLNALENVAESLKAQNKIKNVF
mgnify:CR=1 FL=1